MYFWGGKKNPKKTKKTSSVTFLAVFWEDFAIHVSKRSSSQVSNVQGYVRKLDQIKII